jgi:hypothetical protein
MYRDHNPPHFHISTTGGEAQVSLADLTVIRGGVSKRDFELAIAWVRKNMDLMYAEWDRLNG